MQEGGKQAAAWSVQIDSNPVASLCQYLPCILGRVLTVPAPRSHVKDGAVNSVCDQEVIEQILACLRMHVRCRDGRVETDPSNGCQKQGCVRGKVSTRAGTLREQ